MKRIYLFRKYSWQSSLFAAIGLAIVIGMLLYRLGTLVPGLSNSEVLARIDSSSLHHIVKDPLNAPYKLLVYILIRLHHQGTLVLRGVAALYGVITLSLFFYILKCWQSGRIALMATLLFGTSSWFLHAARAGTPDVLFFGLLIMVAAGLWLRSTTRRTLALYTCMVAVAVSLYVPGFMWFALAATIWRRQAILEELRHVTLLRMLLGAILLVTLIAPLSYALVRQPTLALTVAGLPQHLPALSRIAHNLLNIPLLIFIRGPRLDSTLWLGRLPILDVFDIAMFALGVYAYTRYWRLDRAGLLLGIFVISTLLITIGGPVTITILVPFIYLVIAGGLTYMVHEWFSIFPLNPIARSAGIGLMLIAILASGGYQLDRYFVAWPNDPATKAAFTRQI